MFIFDNKSTMNPSDAQPIALVDSNNIEEAETSMWVNIITWSLLFSFIAVTFHWVFYAYKDIDLYTYEVTASDVQKMSLIIVGMLSGQIIRPIVADWLSRKVLAELPANTADADMIASEREMKAIKCFHERNMITIANLSAGTFRTDTLPQGSIAEARAFQRKLDTALAKSIEEYASLLTCGGKLCECEDILRKRARTETIAVATEKTLTVAVVVIVVLFTWWIA